MYRNFAQLAKLDEKPGPIVSSPLRLAALRAIEFVLIVASFAIASRPLCASSPTRCSSGNRSRDLVWVVSPANPPRPFFLGRESTRSFRPSSVLIFIAALGQGARERERTLEGPHVFG